MRQDGNFSEPQTKHSHLGVCAQLLSRVPLLATLWTVANQAPLFMGFFSQEYWSGLPFPPPGDLPDPGIESPFLMSPALAGRFFIGRQVFYSQGELDGLSRDAILCPVILMICRDFF